MKPGIAIQNTVTGMPDFPGDEHAVTLSAGGPGKLIVVSKCDKCGFSTTRVSKYLCNCGGENGEHQIGVGGCFREIIPFECEPFKIDDNTWDLCGEKTPTKILFDRGYKYHKEYDYWSRIKKVRIYFHPIHLKIKIKKRILCRRFFFVQEFFLNKVGPMRKCLKHKSKR